jgi:stage III sporulation protein AG
MEIDRGLSMNALGVFLEGTRNNFVTKLFKDGVLNTRLVLLGIFGIVLLLAGGVFDFHSPPAKTENVAELPKQTAIVRSYEDALEGKLANLLSQVRGAGSVSVNITLESSSSIEHAKNLVKETRTIQEKDSGGGIRTTTETKENAQILISKENGADRPVMVREYKPVIKGVLVVAEGALDSTVKANLTKAVGTGLGIPSYKITVLPHRR